MDLFPLVEFSDVRRNTTAENNQYPEPHQDEQMEEPGAPLPPAITPINISGSHQHPLLVREVRLALSMPDYPDTHSEGIAYLVDMRAMPKEERVAQASMVQYSTAKKFPSTPSKPLFLDSAPYKRSVLRCTGAKVCEYLAPELQNREHISVGDGDWQSFRQIAERYALPNAEREAIGTCNGLRDLFEKGRACRGVQTPTCKPIVREAEVESISGVVSYYIVCCNWDYGNTHFSKLISSQLAPQVELITSLLREGQRDYGERCTVVKQMSSRMPLCGVDHRQGQGKMRTVACNVQFTVYEPEDPEETPYFMWISHGIHTHIAPPPAKTPTKYLNEIISIIRRINDPSLTTAGLLKHEELRKLCNEYNGSTILDIHNSFSNLDKISALLRKERVLRYPFGTSIPAVLMEYELRHKDKEDAYIQDVYFDGDELAIVCFFKEQAQFLLSRPSFEVDMGFKRVLEHDINEIVLAAWIPEVEKVFTFARVYVKYRDATVYERAFKLLFAAVSRVTSAQVRWRYLHGDGIEAVVTDMDLAQLQGFGNYLRSIDTEDRPWEWQVKQVNIFCSVHFERSIDKAAGSTGRTSTSIHTRMAELRRCQSREEYDELCGELIDSLDSSHNVINWARHKRRAIIAAGINVHCSNVPPEIWERTRRHTNGVEATHWKSNSMGRKLPLKRAIDHAALLDKYDIGRWQAKCQSGITHTYRNTSIASRFQEVVRRDRSRRRPLQEDEDLEDMDESIQRSSQRRRLSRSRSISSSRSISRPRRGSSQRGSSQRRTPTLRQFASSNSLSQAQVVEDERLRDQERRLQLELLQEEVRARRLENDRKQAELQRMGMNLFETDS